MFVEISKKVNELVKKYGELWYKKFFNIHHINFMMDKIQESKSMKKELINKYDKKWYEEHIDQKE